MILPTSLDFQAKSLYDAILRGRIVCWLLFYCYIKTLQPKQLIRAHIQTANTKQRWQIEMMGLLNSQNLPPETDVIQPGHACLLNLLNTNLGTPCVHMPETLGAFSNYLTGLRGDEASLSPGLWRETTVFGKKKRSPRQPTTYSLHGKS